MVENRRFGSTPQRANTRALSMSSPGYVSMYGSCAKAATGRAGSFASGCAAGSHAIISSRQMGVQSWSPSRQLTMHRSSRRSSSSSTSPALYPLRSWIWMPG